MKILLLILSFVPFFAAAEVNDIVLKNNDNKLGVCSRLEDVNNWGYIINSVKVDQNLDDLSFKVIVLNLTCKKSDRKADSVEWAIERPSPILPRNKNGAEMDFVGVSGLLYEAQGYRRAVYSPATDLKAIETYTFDWAKRGLQNKIDHLKESQQMTLKFVFGLKALYRQVGDSRQYQSFSGRFGIYLVWKRINGKVLFERKVLPE